MPLANAAELRDIVADPRALGCAFARHAYGMRRWVDLIGAKLALFSDPEAKALAANLVGDNARHMLIFRARATALGYEPDAYRAPHEGEAIYDRLERLDDPVEITAFALGSLDHFGELLAIYRSGADAESAAAIDRVADDVEAHRTALRARLPARSGDLQAEAGRLYEARELIEAGVYAGS